MPDTISVGNNPTPHTDTKPDSASDSRVETTTNDTSMAHRIFRNTLSLTGANFAWIEHNHFTVMSAEHEDQLYTRRVLEAMLDLTKTKGTVTHTQCQMKGDDHCEYIVEWQ